MAAIEMLCTHLRSLLADAAGVEKLKEETKDWRAARVHSCNRSPTTDWVASLSAAF